MLLFCMIKILMPLVGIMELDNVFLLQYFLFINMEIIRLSSCSLDESLNESSEDNISEEKKFSAEE